MQKSLGIIFIVLAFHHVHALLTNITCRTSNNSACIDPFCFITPVNKTVNAANFGCGRLSRPLNTIKIRQEFYFKFYKNYIPFNFFPEIEYCSFVKNPNQLSYFNGILNVLKEKLPNFVKHCPYAGTDFQVKNLILAKSDLALWIRGEYKVTYTFYDDIDPKIYQVSGKGIIKRS